MKISAAVVVVVVVAFASSISAATYELSWSNPIDQTLTINVNDTVVWTWSNSVEGHNIVYSGPEPDFGDAGAFTSPHQYSHTFTTVGDHPYSCGIHQPNMNGVITVLPTPGPLFELQSTATCGANGTSHITSVTECGYAAALLALDGADLGAGFVLDTAAKPAAEQTYGCAYSQAGFDFNGYNGVRFNSVGTKTGQGADATGNLAVVSICRTADGVAAATDYALGLHNTTTTCATGRAVTTYHECLHAAVTIRGAEITTAGGSNLDNFKVYHFDSHSQPTDSVGVCYHSFAKNSDGNYRYTDGTFHFNSKGTVPTELMSAVCAVPKKELCATDGDFVKGTMGNATCPDGTVTIDTPEECMAAAKTTLKLIPHGSPIPASAELYVEQVSGMSYFVGPSSVWDTDFNPYPGCAYSIRNIARNGVGGNYPVINFNSNFDTGNTVSPGYAPLCRCEAPPPGPPGPAGQVISTTAAGGTTTAKPKDSNPSTLMIVIIVIVAVTAVCGITFLIYINPERFKFRRSTRADMNAQML